MNRTILVLFALSLFALPVCAQEKLTEHTLKLAAGQKSPPATIKEMAWFAGHWTGDGLGGVSEEIWSKPRDGVMLGMYRHHKDGKPVFYELLTLLETQGSLMLRLKHFHANLVGWEEKDKSIEFPLVAIKDGVIHFEGMAFKPAGKDAVTIYLAIHNRKDGSVREETFRYQRINPALQTPVSGGKR